MRRSISVASLVSLLLVPAGVTAADDMQAICTRVVVPPDHALVDSPALRGEPEGGECDAMVYLPPVIADSLALVGMAGSLEFGALIEVAELVELGDVDETLGRVVQEAVAEEDESPEDE